MQPNRFVGQEHSVERLKTCIADLKKLATSKVKKTSAAAQNQNLNIDSYGGDPRYGTQYSKYQDGYIYPNQITV